MNETASDYMYMYPALYAFGPNSFSLTFLSGSSRQMENLLDSDHISMERSPVLVSHRAARDLNTERHEGASFKASLMDQESSRPIIPGNASRVKFVADDSTMSNSSSLGNEIQTLNIDNADSAADVLTPSRTEEAVNFAPQFKEEYYHNNNNKQEFHDGDRSTEDVNDDELDTGGIFDFSEEGNITVIFH